MGEENCYNTEGFVLVHEESFKTLRQATSIIPRYIQNLNPMTR